MNKTVMLEQYDRNSGSSDSHAQKYPKLATDLQDQTQKKLQQIFDKVSNILYQLNNYGQIQTEVSEYIDSQGESDCGKRRDTQRVRWMGIQNVLDIKVNQPRIIIYKNTQSQTQKSYLQKINQQKYTPAITVRNQNLQQFLSRNYSTNTISWKTPHQSPQYLDYYKQMNRTVTMSSSLNPSIVVALEQSRPHEIKQNCGNRDARSKSGGLTLTTSIKRRNYQKINFGINRQKSKTKTKINLSKTTRQIADMFRKR